MSYFFKLIEEMNPAYSDKLQTKGMIVQQIHPSLIQGNCKDA